MDGAQDAPLAAHFKAKRRIIAIVKKMEERGERIMEASPEEIITEATKAAETVFKFDLKISAEDAETSIKKRNRKRNKKRRGKKKQNNAEEDNEDAPPTSESLKPAPQQGNAQDSWRSAPKQQMPTKKTTIGSSSILKLRKATGTESEIAKMHLRYGQGRRNFVAMKQREQRKKNATECYQETAKGNFKFNFAAPS